MSYLKNTSIAQNYKVSNSTVGEWIKGSLEGKNNLQLESYRGKDRILDNEHNQAEMMRLKEFGAKYRTSSAVKKTVPKKEFYEIFSLEEIVEIYNDLKFSSQIDLKFSYEGLGAKLWDKSYQENVSPLKSANEKLLKLAVEDIIAFNTNQASGVSIIDIGTGNGDPALHFINSLKKEVNINKYIGIDISSELLDITKEKFKGSDFELKFYKNDIDDTKFGKIFLEERSEYKNSMNIVLHVDGIYNHDDIEQVLKNFRDGMSEDDILIMTFDNDNLNNRSNFNYNRNTVIHERQIWILKLLGVDTDQCTYKFKYDEKTSSKIKYLIVDKEYNLRFNIFNQELDLVLTKGQEIKIWQHHLIKQEILLKVLTATNFDIITLRKDPTKNFSLVACQAVFDRNLAQL